MLIRLGYDIQFEISAPVAFVAQLRIHPSRIGDLREPDRLNIEGGIAIHEYSDAYGNICTRFYAPAGTLHLWNSTLIEDSGLPDPVARESTRLTAVAVNGAASTSKHAAAKCHRWADEAVFSGMVTPRDLRFACFDRS